MSPGPRCAAEGVVTSIVQVQEKWVAWVYMKSHSREDDSRELGKSLLGRSAAQPRFAYEYQQTD